jgi:hypothetical protein
VPDERTDAERHADEAATFYEHLLHRGIDERAARELAVAYVLGRLRREKREPWEIGDDGP